jgi:chromosome segregation ATPase
LSYDQAAAAVKEHNEWLDAQASPELKALRIRERMVPVESKIEDLRRRLASSELELQSLAEELNAI